MTKKAGKVQERRQPPLHLWLTLFPPRIYALTGQPGSASPANMQLQSNLSAIQGHRLNYSSKLKHPFSLALEQKASGQTMQAVG